jgi:hypothetical protein
MKKRTPIFFTQADCPCGAGWGTVGEFPKNLKCCYCGKVMFKNGKNITHKEKKK